MRTLRITWNERPAEPFFRTANDDVDYSPGTESNDGDYSKLTPDPVPYGPPKPDDYVDPTVPYGPPKPDDYVDPTKPYEAETGEAVGKDGYKVTSSSEDSSSKGSGGGLDGGKVLTSLGNSLINNTAPILHAVNDVRLGQNTPSGPGGTGRRTSTSGKKGISAPVVAVGVVAALAVGYAATRK